MNQWPRFGLALAGCLAVTACWGVPSDYQYRLVNDTGRVIHVDACNEGDVRLDNGATCDIDVPPVDKFNLGFRFSTSTDYSDGCIHSATGETPFKERQTILASSLMPCRE